MFASNTRFILLCHGLALAAASVSCTDSRVCTDVGCSDGAFMSLRTADNSWLDGAYDLQLELDSASYACKFALPGDLPQSRGSLSMLMTCEPRLDTTLLPETECSEQRDTKTVSQTCTPSAGQYHLEISTPLTPQRAHVRLLRDGELVADRTQALSYETALPNGPGCGPACRQSHVTLLLDSTAARP